MELQPAPEATAPPVEWCSMAREEFPPDDVAVWAYDGHRVFRGVCRHAWSVKAEDLFQHSWRDEAGHAATATHWLPLELSSDPPAPPAPPAAKGSISRWLGNFVRRRFVW